ncbi:MAG: hypothetical protein IJS49_05210 [Paludibacteraceae bacterium]|nr:hypothetical protein [Paludibacteraceae bacterium]
MKKLFVACAIVLSAGLFASCGDTQYCYEITTTYTILGQQLSNTTRAWCTKNEIKSYEASAKDAAVKLGASEDAIKVSSKLTGLSQNECK